MNTILINIFKIDYLQSSKSNWRPSNYTPTKGWISSIDFFRLNQLFDSEKHQIPIPQDPSRQKRVFPKFGTLSTDLPKVFFHTHHQRIFLAAISIWRWCKLLILLANSFSGRNAGLWPVLPTSDGSWSKFYVNQAWMWFHL